MHIIYFLAPFVLLFDFLYYFFNKTKKKSKLREACEMV